MINNLEFWAIFSTITLCMTNCIINILRAKLCNHVIALENSNMGHIPCSWNSKKNPVKTRLENIAGQSNMQISVRGSKHSWYKPYKDKSFAVSNCILRFFFALLIPKGGNKTVLVGRRIVVFFSHTLSKMHWSRNSKLYHTWTNTKERPGEPMMIRS